MADSFSALLRLRLQQTGANNNTWGGLLNAAAIQLIEDSVAGRTVITVAGADITLSTNNGANDQARMSTISLIGAPGAIRNIIVPNVSKWYIFENLSGSDQIVKTAAGTGNTVKSGDRKFVLCDGTNVFGVADTLGGLDASAFARLASRNAYTAGNSDGFDVAADGATVTFDSALGNVFKTTLGGNRAAALANMVDGSWNEIYITQDGTGGRTLTWPSNIKWEGGGAPTLSTAPNATDKVFLRYDLAITTWIGEFSRNFGTSGGGTISDIVLSGGNVDVDAFALAGSPASAVTFTLRVGVGVVVQASSAASPAINFDGFAAGSVISIVNEGYILGRGGRGGRGAFAGDVTSADLFGDGTAGTPGGPAIKLPAAACTTSITNATGFIWGGGGAGGGGGVTHNGDGSNVGVGGGGGGGGAGGGIPGDGGSVAAANGNPGVSGSVGRQGVGGAGGTGVQTGGTGSAGTGGAGGAYGAAGSAGATLTANTLDGAPGAGGAAGKAIDVNGGTAPTFVSGSGSPNVKGAIS